MKGMGHRLVLDVSQQHLELTKGFLPVVMLWLGRKGEFLEHTHPHPFPPCSTSNCISKVTADHQGTGELLGYN